MITSSPGPLFLFVRSQRKLQGKILVVNLNKRRKSESQLLYEVVERATLPAVQSAKKFPLKNMMKDFALISSTGIFSLALIGIICPVS